MVEHDLTAQGPRQAPASFFVDKVLEELTRANAALAEDGPIGPGN